MQQNIGYNKIQVTKRGIPFETATGKLVFPLDLDVEDVDIEDIAHALSNLCRYGGHCRKFYSVAQHSVEVSNHCLKRDAFAGLLHDASEAYLVDLPRPVKVFMSDYRIAEERVQRTIAEKYGINWPFPPSIHEADTRMLVTEMRDLMSHYINEAKIAKPYKENIIPMTPSQAKKAFMNRYQELSNGIYRQRR